MSSITYVLVHGAFSTAASWGPTARELALRGHRVVAVDLPGHGLDARETGMAGLSTADDVAAVTAVVRRVEGPVVLVGHSRGGLTVTAVANAVPELLAHVVYVSAWCCVVGGPSAYATVAPSALDALAPRLLTADPAEVGELRVDLRDPGALDDVQDALLADGTRTELLAMLATMDGRESLVVDEAAVTVDAERWGRVPRTYVRLAEDRALMPALQDRFVADAEAVGLPFDVVELATSHLGVQLRPGPLVEVLAGLA